MKIQWIFVRNFILVYILGLYVYLIPLRNFLYLKIQEYYGTYCFDKSGIPYNLSRNVFSVRNFINPYGVPLKELNKIAKTNVRINKLFLTLICFFLIGGFLFAGGVPRFNFVDKAGDVVTLSAIFNRWFENIGNTSIGHSPFVLVIVLLYVILMYGPALALYISIALYLRYIFLWFAFFSIPFGFCYKKMIKSANSVNSDENSGIKKASVISGMKKNNNLKQIEGEKNEFK